MPSPSTTEFAPAKVNLTLHVTGQRDDGYHLLDSLVVFCGIGDWLTVRVAKSMSLTVIGPFAADVPGGADNLVMRAAAAFAGDLKLAITLEKNLPPASGLGGGSSDAAAVIRAIRLLRPSDQAQSLSVDETTTLALGADVPVCLAAQPARMRGIGEQLDRIPPVPPTHIVLVNPRVAVPTPTVFRALRKKQGLPMPDRLPDWPDAAALAGWLATQRNDLETPARGVAPVIGEVLDALSSQPGALMARMSGSGATCFALFATENAAQTAADAIATAQRQWWTAAGPVLGEPPSPPS